MSYVIAAPDILTAAATDLVTIGSSLAAAHAEVATPTVALAPAAADEVSASIAHVFSQDAKDYQAIATLAAVFHEQLSQNLNASARSYASTEAASTSSLRSLKPVTRPRGSVSAGAQNQSLQALTIPSREAAELMLLLLLLLPIGLPLAIAFLLLTGHLP